MSPNVKQANFRLPLSYMDLIDEISSKENITKAAVITRALDCLKASYDSGNGGMPVAGGSQGANDEEVRRLRDKLAKAEERVEKAEAKAEEASRAAGSGDAQASELRRRAQDAESRAERAEKALDRAEQARDAAESRAHAAEVDLAKAQARAEASSMPTAEAIATAEENVRLKALVAKHEASLEEKTNSLAARGSELAAKNAEIAERDARIASLSEQLGAANAKIELAQTVNEVKAVMVGDAPQPEDADTARALYMFNMLGGVMGAFQQQVADARVVGEQEGRSAVQRELQDSLERARNDGYRDAMTYLDDRVTTAKESGAREERARIANMTFFERRRYLRMHIA